MVVGAPTPAGFRTRPKADRYAKALKLVRFDLKAEPGSPRAGMLHNGRIYESEHGQAVAVHEAAEVRPLSPVERPPSIRLFATGSRDEADDPLRFVYANPAAIVGPSQLIPLPDAFGPYSVRTYLGAVLTDSPREIDEEDADKVILGYTMVAAVALEYPARERFGAALDFGIAVGPALITPDELADVFDAGGYDLAATLRVEGVEKTTRSLLPLFPTISAAVASAARTAPLRAGDLIAIGPLFDPALTPVEAGDEVALAIERLGTLAVKLTSPEEEY
ncbi:MAG: hypothetical protein C4320_04750 [Armatimonadota bacterium]